MSLLLQFILILAIIVVCAKYAGSLAVRIGQPAVFGQLLAGLILGPTVLNILGLPIFKSVEVELTSHLPYLADMPTVFIPIKLMAEVGVIFLMFIAGLETDLKQMMRVGKTAFWSAVGGIIGPFLLGALTAYIFLRSGLMFTAYEVIFIGTILTATSVSITAQTLIELRALRSREGTTIIGAAVIDDVLGLLLLSLVIAFKPKGVETEQSHHNLLDLITSFFAGRGLTESSASIIRILLVLVLMIFFALLSYAIYRYFLRPLLENMSRQRVAEALLGASVFFALIFAFMAEYIGNLAAITGSYLCGVMIAQTPFRHDVTEKMRTLTYGFFVSVFFVSIGLEANARTVFAPLAQPSAVTREQILLVVFALVIILVAIATKVLGCLIGAILTGFSALESYRVGVGMVSRGEVGLIVASVGYSAGIIQLEVFSTMVLMVLITTLITPIWLRQIFPRRPIETFASTRG